MADAQHPAVPFEQAVDLLTGEPRPLRPQHPDITALVSCGVHALCTLGAICDYPRCQCKEAPTAARKVVEAALRTLTRPVEDEEVRATAAFLAESGNERVRESASLLASLARERSLLEGKLCDRQTAATELARERDIAIDNMRAGWSALGMIREAVEQQGVGLVAAGEHLDGPTAEHEAEAIVAGVLGLARQKASAEQEIARLRENLTETLEYLSLLIGEVGDPGTGALCAAENARRALAMAVGVEEPR